MAIVNIARIVILSCLIVKIRSYEIHANQSENLYKTYRCQSGIYDFNKIICHERLTYCNLNLFDPSHEHFKDCDKKCGPGKFKCTKADNTTMCLDITARCNTIEDCLNGTDELNCGDETNVNDCHFHQGKFLCADKLKCLDLEFTCDGFCNCFDCSDENSNCTKNENLKEKCPNSYFPTPNGAQCFCDPDNEQLDELCKKVEDCSFEHFCSQRCSRYKSKLICSCYDHNSEVAGSKGARCYSNESLTDVLVYSTSSKIKALNVNSSKNSVLLNKVECATLSAAHKYIYFTTYRDQGQTIYASEIGSQISSPIIKWNSTITSIAVDYITNNIYFTSSGSLLVCSNDSRVCRTLKCCEIDSITLTPKSGLMFYTSKTSRDSERFIMKSAMDGLNEEILVDSSFNDITGLTVDEFAERIYWMSRSDRSLLYSSSFDGFFRQHDSLYSDYLDEIFMTVSQKKLYATVKRKNYIGLVKPTSRMSNPTKFYQDIYTTSVELLFLYNPTIQDIYKAKNPCNATSCPNGLCLLRPVPRSKTVLQSTCV